MARPGRPKKPDAVRIYEGSHPERMHGDAPTSPEGVDAAPDWLDEFGKEAWSRLVDRLAEMRVLTRADFDAVLTYSLAYSDMRHADAAIKQEGRTLKGGQDGNGPLKAHPLYVVKQNATRTMISIMGQLGMTPSARASLHVEPAPVDDELQGVINGLRKGAKGN